MASQRFLPVFWTCPGYPPTSISSFAPTKRATIISRTVLARQTARTPHKTTRFASTVADPASSTAPPPAPRSLTRRFVSVLIIGFITSSAGFAMASAPAYTATQDLMNPPTDKETLELFVAPDDFSAEVNENIRNHPIAVGLRGNPDFTEARPYFKIPEQARTHFLTGGVLSGPGLIWVPPLAFAEKDGKSMTILYYLGNDLSGHPGVIHGGLQATLLDEALARCSMGALPNKISMTANLNINYRAPMPTNSYIVARAELEKVEGRKAWVKGRLESASVNGEAPKVYVEATGLFIEPKQAATMKRLYPAATSST